jgi:hypothetical protein
MSGSSDQGNSGPPLVHCIQCDHPMRIIRGHVTWEGDWEYNRYIFECTEHACQTTAEIVWRTFIPVDVARMRDR